LFISSSSSINPIFSPRSFPYEAICIPVNTTSFIPWLATCFISFIIFSTFLLLTLPLAYGIMQYVQKLLQPSSIFMTALVFSVYVMSPNSANSSCFDISEISINVLKKYLDLFDMGEDTKEERKNLLDNQRIVLENKIKKMEEAHQRLLYKLKLYQDNTLDELLDK